MKYIDLEEQIFIPAHKICEVIKNQENEKGLTFWLDGNQVQNVTFASKEDRDRNYKAVTDMLKEMDI